MRILVFGYRIKPNPEDLNSVMQQGAFVREITKNSFFTPFQTVRRTAEIQPTEVIHIICLLMQAL